MNVQTPNALSIVDGFDAQDPTASPIRGTNIKFKDGNYYAFSDQIDVQDRAFAVLDRIEGWQKLAKECPPEYLIRNPGESRPPQPHVDRKDWPLDLNGKPEHPWKWTIFFYLLDVATGEISTFWTNTKGGYRASRELGDQVKFMRQVRSDAIPIVALESTDMPTQYKTTKPRPRFRLLGWKTRGSVGPQNLLLEQQHAEPSMPNIQEIEAPSLSAELNDAIPDFDVKPAKKKTKK